MNLFNESHNQIEGLEYKPEFISSKEEISLISQIDKEIWSTELSRRVQHYGYKYNYKTRSINATMKLGNLPDWALPIAKKLHNEKIFMSFPTQMIVNEYLPGQGISKHIDCEPCFGNVIVSLSLGSPTMMRLQNVSDNSSPESCKLDYLLERRSIIILKGKSRFNWTHEIMKSKSFKYNGIKINKSRRISLTFRNVILE